ncbi:serine/threonine-protein kinase 19 isoform X5 [Ursus americanus]|uniref:serine/threonine-protein kinase 19 isoform X5 n=1 Tax=Ursus americanus TaxID=9643 RepID=UPI001E67B5DE|nr:serine/threonine-protein kinase 19 isoform X5 [Ursus americanus]
MSRKRQRLVPDAFGLKRRRERGQAEAEPLRGESGSARAAVAELVQLFPRGLFEDALPPIALRSQVYSLVPDRTAADRQLVSGVGATDGSRFPASRALPRGPITLTRSGSAGARAGVRSLWAGPCWAKENATDPVKRPSGSGELATSWRWKSDSFGKTEASGIVGALLRWECRQTSDRGRPRAFSFA